MGYLTRIAFLLLIGTVCQSATINNGGGCGGGGCGGTGNGNRQVVLAADAKDPFPVQVPFSGEITVPIRYIAADYSGPYDPFDPDGSAAASHRALQISGQKAVNFIKSYIPPNIDEFIKAEVMGILKREGQRFLISHPREAADLFSIYRNINKLIQRGQEILKENDAQVVVNNG